MEVVLRWLGQAVYISPSVQVQMQQYLTPSLAWGLLWVTACCVEVCRLVSFL